MRRAMQQFEGRSAATVLRDDAQRSRVEAHAVQLNLEAHGGQVVVVLKRGKARKWIQQRFWGMILVWNVYSNHNLCPWNHLRPNSQWWFAIRYNTQRHRISKSEKMPSCKIFVSDLGPKTWKIALLSCESVYRFSIKLVHFESKQQNMINHSNTFTSETSGHQTTKVTEIWITLKFIKWFERFECNVEVAPGSGRSSHAQRPVAAPSASEHLRWSAWWPPPSVMKEHAQNFLEQQSKKKE